MKLLAAFSSFVFAVIAGILTGLALERPDYTWAAVFGAFALAFIGLCAAAIISREGR